MIKQKSISFIFLQHAWLEQQIFSSSANILFVVPLKRNFSKLSNHWLSTFSMIYILCFRTSALKISVEQQLLTIVFHNIMFSLFLYLHFTNIREEYFIRMSGRLLWQSKWPCSWHNVITHQCAPPSIVCLTYYTCMFNLRCIRLQCISCKRRGHVAHPRSQSESDVTQEISKPLSCCIYMDQQRIIPGDRLYIRTNIVNRKREIHYPR